MRQLLTRKTVSWGIAIVFLLFTLASVCFGNAGVRATAPGGAVVKPVVPLEEAIRIVRTNFEVPGEYSDFTSGYNGNTGSQYWFLQWTAPARPGFDCSAQVNAANGEILSFSMDHPDSQTGTRLQEPGVSSETARVTATRLIRQVTAGRLAELRPVQDEVNILGGPVSYTFHWERVVGGVPFPANGVSVQVSGDDGRVTGYYLSWLQATFPDAAGAISPERARQVFENAGMLELQYYQSANPQAATAPEKQPVLLVYKLVHPSGGVIDALGGKPLVINAAPAPNLTYGLSPQLSLSTAGASFELRPEEIREINKLAGFQSQDQATATVRKWVPEAGKMALQSARLTADRQAGIYTWDLSFRAAVATKPGNLDARVNALTGELVGFDHDPVTSFGVHWQSRAAAQKMAAEFLQRVQPQRFQDVVLEQDLNSASAPLWGVQYPPIERFNYRRMVNGIPFPANYMTVNVDTQARRLVHFGLNWTSADFPATQEAISLQQAYDAFFKNRPQVLMYVRDASTGIISLVYQPQAQPGMPDTDLLDARTGAALDYSGQTVTALAVPHRFNDIAGTPESKEIALLGQAGLFGEYGDTFHPQEPVTAASLLRAMLELKNGIGSYGQAPDQEFLRQAVACGWLKEDLQPGSRVTREELARIVVRMLGLERAAEAPGIYRIPFANAGSIAPDDTGYVALAWGLGIMKDEGSMFHPGQSVTRAEAAAVLVRAFQ